ncbi:MAG: SDR family NAD(P)-dependent oxidoreductase [Firmicutes bacterium]|nr:SDR family NAD(P)-dependent oxidoreductase [Candidatus Fermentithermobacillaceae bacterium]
MGTFGFIIHPVDISDVARKFPVSRYLPSGLVERSIAHLKPFEVSEINGIKSDHGTANGYFVTCPLTPRMMMSMPEDKVIKKIIDSARLAQDLGAKVVGLGAFTAVVGDAGITISKNVDIAVTTGNSYTVYTAIEATLKAAELMDIDMDSANVLVLGATGSIGRVLSMMLSDHGFNLTLAARNSDRLNEVARAVNERSGVTPYVTTDISDALKQADVVLCVSSAVEAIVHPDDLKSGALVCDVARPRNVSAEVKKQRQDVLVIEGGVVRVPGDVDFNFDFGFPKGHSYACMAETMILALEEKYVNWSLGRELTVEQVEGIANLARKHGFEVGGFRSFERPVTLEEIEQVKRNAATKRRI